MGIGEAIPTLGATSPTAEELTAQAAAAAARLAPRVATGPFIGTDGDPDGTLRRAQERLTELCGAAVPLLTRLTPAADAFATTNLGRTDPPIPGADNAAVRDWLYRHGTVRPAVCALLDSYDLAESLGCPASLQLNAAQRPVIGDPDRWVGTDPAPREGLTHLLVVPGYPAGTVPATLTGLVVDAWTQTVPAANRTTGLAFHFDQPTASAPQTVLLAVAPDTDPDRRPATWDLDTLVDVVTSTMALAADRAVTPEAWGDGAPVTVTVQGS